MRFLVFVSVLVFASVANAQTWVYRSPVTTATYDPVTATTTYRQCFCDCYVTGKCTCHPCCVRTWKTYNVPEKARRGILKALDFGHRVITLPFKKEINGRKPLFFYPVHPQRKDRLPTTVLR